jgi:hypothetical protein
MTTVTPIPMKAYKFVVPTDRFYPLPEATGLAFKGCLAVVLAASEEEARARLVEYAALDGLESRWLEVARVVEIPLVFRAVLAWAML